MAEYTDLDQALANPQDVTKLDLSDNQLKNLPTKISKLTNLTHLNLSYNKPKTISFKPFKKDILCTIGSCDHQWLLSLTLVRYQLILHQTK